MIKESLLKKVDFGYQTKERNKNITIMEIL